MTPDPAPDRREDGAILFDGTAPYYARYRPPYPVDAIRAMCEGFQLDGQTPVLDLGCGTGQIALPLAAAGCQVWAVDPNPEMLAEGIRLQSAYGRVGDGIRWMLGDDATLSRMRLPRLRLCAMGAAFHWTDREALLLMLDSMIEQPGGVALLSGSASIWSKEESLKATWVAVAREVVQEFLGPQRRAGCCTYAHPERSHEDVLARSPFSEIHQAVFTTVREMDVDDVIGLQLSTSYASPALLGEALPAFREKVTVKLLNIEPSGRFETVEQTHLITARRPG